MLRALGKRHEAENRIRDLRFGQLDALVANALRGKNGQQSKPEDFVFSAPRSDGRQGGGQRVQSLDEMAAMAEMICIAFGGIDKREGHELPAWAVGPKSPAAS